MRVTTSKSKNSESFYISKGYVNNKGVSTLLNMPNIRKRYVMPRWSVLKKCPNPGR